MQILLAVCLVLGAVAVGFVTVYLVQTLAQLKRTARALELLADNLNREVEKVQSITNAAANLAGAFGGTFGKTAGLIFSLARGLLKGFWRNKGNGDGETAKEETKSGASTGF